MIRVNAAGAAQEVFLKGVACVAPGSCMATGSYINSSKEFLPLIETTGAMSKIANPVASSVSAAPTSSPTALPGPSTTTTAPATVITPGNDTPENAVDGLSQAELAGNWTQACSYLAPSSQSACEQDASQLPVFTGSVTVVGDVISGEEALVEVTGSMCASGSCTSNSDPSAGMPGSGESFTEAYDQAVNNSTNSFSPVPCIEENGEWYINYSQ